MGAGSSHRGICHCRWNAFSWMHHRLDDLVRAKHGLQCGKRAACMDIRVRTSIDCAWPNHRIGTLVAKYAEDWQEAAWSTAAWLTGEHRVERLVSENVYDRLGLLAITEKDQRLQSDVSRHKKNCYFEIFNLLFAGGVWLQCARQKTVPYVGIRSVSALKRRSPLIPSYRKIAK